MKRSRLKNKANKTKSCNDIINYKKQTVKLNKKSKFEYFNKYDPNRQAKPFWVNCKPYFFQTGTVKLAQTCLVKTVN